MTSPAPRSAPSVVAAIPAAPSDVALAHFRARLGFETDCSDVHAALASGAPDFVLAEARGPNAYAAGRIAGAINLPHREITAERMAEWPADTLFVVYCAGPHCNGADRAAIKLAELGRPVKVMIGGLAGWLDEGFTLEQA
ncbi:MULTISPECIES: rhodanese-like domain-containing protein [Inquilinus]|uniref:Rhodanese-related sulfurtransferase n=1 Tax=Inquilinus ginsengisoli TaxID=363840 RepID=A0ABU1JUG2_9PROT|nr:rhodanese-like domain-containing protein [Inquilinus ginsengisoli]MDR6292261.1 rhodanese-related sulfurtransferase [Inquilinus ginsengisoli]